MLKGPTSLNRGEGFVVWLMGEVRGGEDEGKGVVRGWWRGGRRSENDGLCSLMGLMSV